MRPLRCYVVLWAASTLLRILMASGRGDPITPSYQFLAVAVCCATLMPARPLVVATAFAVRFVLFFLVGGSLSNSQNWAMHLDLTMVLALLPYCLHVKELSATDEADVVAMAAPTLRLQLVIFYLASGVWKINSSFIDSKYSCASIYAVSLTGHRLSDNESLLRAVALVAPVATIIVELLLPSATGGSIFRPLVTLGRRCYAGVPLHDRDHATAAQHCHLRCHHSHEALFLAARVDDRSLRAAATVAGAVDVCLRGDDHGWRAHS